MFPFGQPSHFPRPDCAPEEMPPDQKNGRHRRSKPAVIFPLAKVFDGSTQNSHEELFGWPEGRTLIAGALMGTTPPTGWPRGASVPELEIGAS